MATIDGTAGNDNLVGTSANDLIYGLAGNDTLDGRLGNDTVYGGDNNDTLYGDFGADSLYGGLGQDYLSGGAANDSLLGEAGNDTLNGGTGNDTLNGGTGNDTYLIKGEGIDLVTEAANAGTDTVQSSISYTLGANLENLSLSGTSAITGSGNTLNNRLTGNSANNTLYGGAGSDTLEGGGGTDSLRAGTGNDIYIVDSTTDAIVDEAGTDTVQSSVSYTLGSTVENLILTGSNPINGTGNTFNNTITGTGADNILTGGGGDDTLYNGNQKDYKSGDPLYEYGAGDDTLIGGEGNDLLQDITGFGPKLLHLKMYGGPGNDRLISRSKSSFLDGGVGDDSLSSWDWSDLEGGDGNDTLDANYSRVNGGNGNDVLEGNESRLYGGNGNDTLIAYGEGEFLSRLAFNSLTEGIDTIINFVPGNSHIEVSAAGFGGGLVPASNPDGTPQPVTVEQFVLGTAARDASDRFIYNQQDGALYFDKDGIGATGQVQFATLSGMPTISNNDIYVVELNNY